MDKRTIREAGRKKAVRDRVWERRQEQPCRKSGTIMRQAGRYRAIDTAKKQVNEARDALIPEPDQEPYTATDKVETAAANSANMAMNNGDEYCFAQADASTTHAEGGGQRL